MRVCIVGYLRPEKNFDSLDALIEAIHTDISDAERLLDDPESASFKNHEFFLKSKSENVIVNGQTKTESNGHHI